MSKEVHREISLFRSLIKNRRFTLILRCSSFCSSPSKDFIFIHEGVPHLCRFDDTTLRILESILVCNDVKLLLQITSTLKNFMRYESLQVLREISALRSVDDNLNIVEFLVRVFALIGDDESCLALRYEALLMRERNSPSDQRLRVSCVEWFTFAEHSFQNGFCSIARMACEKALLCFDTNSITFDSETGQHFKYLIEKIEELKDSAAITASSHSVQAKTAQYLKIKPVETHSDQTFPLIEVIKGSASVMFREGIKRHHLRQLHDARGRYRSSEMS
ncbi:unnamed protein product [Cuscuta epithymum]|uniref:Uncharacterized protein n=1 Tax=Cuscuta epithymum TaxID=186058 RepID=A0AAV0FY68_9ASTE|nr:unnamed protein product [Cuscuta epithymum]